MKLLNWLIQFLSNKQELLFIPSNIPIENENKHFLLIDIVEWLNVYDKKLLVDYKAKYAANYYIECRISNIIELIEILETYRLSLIKGGDLSKAKSIRDYEIKTIIMDDYFSNDNNSIKPIKAYELLTEVCSSILISLTENYDLSKEYFDRRLTLILREVCVAIETLYRIGIEKHGQTKN